MKMCLEGRANLNRLSIREKFFLIIKELPFPFKIQHAKKFSVVHFSPLSFSSVIENVANAIRQENKIRGIKLERKR